METVGADLVAPSDPVVPPVQDLVTVEDLAPPDLTPPPDMAQPILAFDVVASPTLVEEHHLFNLHLTARTTGNAVLTGYVSGVKLTSDWGDVSVITAPVFASGQADATVWLNRETNPTNGLAHITATDGSATGTSQGITVTAPTWTALSGTLNFAKGNAGTWDDGSITSPSLVLVSGTYYLFYIGSGDVGTGGVGRATTTDFATWTHSANSVFSAASSGWDTLPPIYPAVQWDGAKFIMTYVSVIAGFTTSADGLTWAHPSAPMVANGAVPSCDHLQDSGIWIDSPGHFVALAFAHPSAGLVNCRLTSADSGATWPIASVQVASGVPNVLTHAMAALIKDGSVYRFWNAGHYYTSTDALNWVLSPTDPVTLFPRTLLWNAAKNRYEGLADSTGATFAVITRP